MSINNRSVSGGSTTYDSDEENASDENTCSSIVKQSCHIKQKKRQRDININMTNIEKKLYKNIVVMKINESRCKTYAKRKKVTLKAVIKIISNPAFIKTAENIISAARILTMLKFRKLDQKRKEKRFYLKEKIIALSVLKQSPMAYRFFWKIFVLPSPQQLKASHDDMSAGINKNIFSMLKKSAPNLTKRERLCMILFKEILIRPRLRKDKLRKGRNSIDRCLVFMLRGLRMNLKQPLTYSFSRGRINKVDLARKIKAVIRDVIDTRFIPIATVCDHRVNNQNAIKYLIDETKREFLLKGKEHEDNVFYVKGREIIPLFDPPQLMRSIRNELLTKNLKYCIDEKVGTAKWDHIILFYENEPKFDGRKLIYKLTEKHVIPKKICKTTVLHAVQLFSLSVCRFMASFAGWKLPKELRETVDFILFFDKLFDSLNGTCARNTYHEKRKPLLDRVTPYSKHHTLWKESIEALKTMEFESPIAHNGSQCINSWIWMLEGCEYLTKRLLEKYNIIFTWMGRINLDALENILNPSSKEPPLSNR